MNIKIRKGIREDIPQVFALIHELAVYEKGEHLVTNNVEQMLIDGFGENPVYQLLVAESENQIVGIAISYIKYSTWRGKGVFLEDIVVTEAMRGKGIGKMLFDEVIKFAKGIHAKQLQWQVLDWNEPAINFYKKYNANFDDEWINCSLNEDDLLEGSAELGDKEIGQ